MRPYGRQQISDELDAKMEVVLALFCWSGSLGSRLEAGSHRRRTTPSVPGSSTETSARRSVFVEEW
jgi:hypothetical protein